MGVASKARKSDRSCPCASTPLAKGSTHNRRNGLTCEVIAFTECDGAKLVVDSDLSALGSWHLVEGSDTRLPGIRDIEISFDFTMIS